MESKMVFSWLTWIWIFLAICFWKYAGHKRGRSCLEIWSVINFFAARNWRDVPISMKLVVGFKYFLFSPLSQNGNLPQVMVKITNIWNHHLVQVFGGPMSTHWALHMGVSKNNGTQIIHFNRVFHHTPSILGAHPYFWKHPYIPGTSWNLWMSSRSDRVLEIT